MRWLVGPGPRGQEYGPGRQWPESDCIRCQLTRWASGQLRLKQTSPMDVPIYKGLRLHPPLPPHSYGGLCALARKSLGMLCVWRHPTCTHSSHESLAPGMEMSPPHHVQKLLFLQSPT